MRNPVTTLLALTLALACALSASAAPGVLRVEPPSWWPGHSIDPVRLLVRGSELRGARLDCPQGSGLAAGPVTVNGAGSYAFVDLTIQASAQPGVRTLTLSTPDGSADLRFEVLAPLPRDGRFQGLSEDDVIYLAMPDRFANGDATNDDPQESRGLFDRSRARYYHGGDFAGLIAKLPYFRSLGVTALWLNPWYENHDGLNQRETYDGQPITDYHGYGATDFYDVEEHFGTLADLRALVDRAHALGIKVVQDQVANHCGPYHPWVVDPPTATWFHGTQASHQPNTWQTWTLQDPAATEAVRKATLEGWFIDILPDLNHEDPEVARYVIQSALWWVGVSGLDAIRQDTLPYVPRIFWRDWAAALAREYPRLTTVGELFDADPSLVSFFQGGRARYDGVDSGIHALFDFPSFFEIRKAFARGGNLRELAMMRARDHLYVAPERLVTFLGLHDVSRFMSEQAATVEGLQLAFAFLTTARGIPLVYYGDEIGLTGGNDPDNRRDFPGGWPGDPRDAFAASGRSADETRVFDFVERALRLRAATPALRRGRSLNLLVDEQVWVYAREWQGEVAVVVLNNGTQPAFVDVPVGDLGLRDGAALEDAIGDMGTAQVEAGRLSTTVPARRAAVFSNR